MKVSHGTVNNWKQPKCSPWVLHKEEFSLLTPSLGAPQQPPPVPLEAPRSSSGCDHHPHLTRLHVCDGKVCSCLVDRYLLSAWFGLDVKLEVVNKPDVVWNTVKRKDYRMLSLSIIITAGIPCA